MVRRTLIFPNVDLDNNHTKIIDNIIAKIDYILYIWLIYGYSFVVLQGFNLYFLLLGRQHASITVGDFVLVLMLNVGISEHLWQLAQDMSQFSKLFGKIAQAIRTITAPYDLLDVISSYFQLFISYMIIASKYYKTIVI